jgi:hypothetical protein
MIMIVQPARFWRLGLRFILALRSAPFMETWKSINLSYSEAFMKRRMYLEFLVF